MNYLQYIKQKLCLIYQKDESSYLITFSLLDLTLLVFIFYPSRINLQKVDYDWTFL